MMKCKRVRVGYAWMRLCLSSILLWYAVILSGYSLLLHWNPVLAHNLEVHKLFEQFDKKL